MQSVLTPISNSILTIESSAVRELIDSLANALDSLRSEGTISNDAYLDAGAIQGGMMMIANLIDAGIDRNELASHMSALVSRSNHVEEAHPGLSAAVESVIS
ncbi:MAG: hypothetical protein ACJZ49_06195 [Candidatus Thalassarchaeaceae archaeon]|nr:MAG: hypothetical protein CBC45_005750 [Euryarchaeota archaeon TMED85]|tara:strand:+ start:1920 stop:2225 length:306 start_codon:yes stop_codon:yes gene_type:complete